jgi:hypothetical protein
MRVYAAGLILLMSLSSSAFTQVLFQENFDSTSTLPQGWSVWNRQPFPIAPQANWTVRDTGVVPPGIGNNRTKAHSLPRAVGVSWWSSIDTTGAPSSVADAWLVTKRVRGISSGDGVKFWASGGSVIFLDSLQVWVSAVDSTPTGMISGRYMGSVIWPVGSVFGHFTQYVFGLTGETGYDVWIGFRYYMNCSQNGFYVHIDDVSVEPATSVTLTDDGVPALFGLHQNYPNPFNGETTIGFSLPAAQSGMREAESRGVNLVVYDVLGRAVASVVDEPLAPGLYRVPFNASGLASGVYLYRLSAGGSVETRRMILMK